MFKSFKDYITGKTFLEMDKDGTPVDQKLRVAVVALLWEMAHIDGHCDPSEYEDIVATVDREFHMMDDEAGELISVADFLRRTNQQLDRYITEINDHFDDEQRQHLYELIWQVAQADGRIEKVEQDFATFLKEKLKLQ